MENNFFHLDMDSFYASIEEQRIKKNVPLVVSHDSSKSIILASNSLAKKDGINSKMPIYIALQKNPNILICKPNLQEYKFISLKIEKLLLKFTKNVEKASIDEWYMNFDDTKLIFQDEYELASRIQNAVKKEFDLNCSIGISYNPFFAKMASKMNKPNGIEIISNKNFKKKIWNLDIKELHFIGEKNAKKMDDLGIKKIFDLANFKDLKNLKKLLGITGIKIYEYVNGEFNKYNSKTNKSISVTSTFDTSLKNYIEISINFNKILNEIIEKIKIENILIKNISIKIKTKNDTETKSFTFSEFTNDYSLITFQSNIIFDKFKNLNNLKKISINFYNIIYKHQNYDQLNLFENKGKNIPEKINLKFNKKIIDYANKK